MAQRLHPSDFRTRSEFGLGRDWPLSYEDLRPWYAAAERELGVAGEARPGTPPRRSAYPMPAFPDGYGDAAWRETADRMGIDIGPAPYAKNSRTYGGRPACQMYATCNVCPIGAQYSADVHVREAEASGRCRLLTETVARRIDTDASGRVRALHATRLDGTDVELTAGRYVVAAHAVESARLLMLSDLGGRSGQLGRNLMEHWYVGGRGRRDERTFPGRFGFHILESSHYYEEDRGSTGAVKLEFTDGYEPLSALTRSGDPLWGEELADHECREFGHWLTVTAETEQQPRPDSRVSLDPEATDRFGDPAPRVSFRLGETERRTRRRGVTAVADVLEAAGCTDLTVWDAGSPAAHHMGTCRMAPDPEEGVVDRDLRVHGTDGLYVASSAVFPTAGAVQPTLTIAALALRLADHLARTAVAPGGG